MGAGEVAAQKTARVERIGGQQMQDAEAGLHPDHAAQQIGGSDERLAEKLDVSACAEEGERERACGEQVGDGPGEAEHELARAVIGAFLAFGVGVGEEAADGQHENSTQAQAEPGGGEKACGFADEDGDGERKEEAEAACPAVIAGEAEAHEGQQRIERVDAQFYAEPAAQRD